MLGFTQKYTGNIRIVSRDECVVYGVLCKRCVHPVQNYTIEQKRAVFFKFVDVFSMPDYPQDLKAKVRENGPHP